MKKLIIEEKHLDRAIKQFVRTEYGGNYTTTCLVTQAAKDLFVGEEVTSCVGEIELRRGINNYTTWIPASFQQQRKMINLMKLYDDAVFNKNQQLLSEIRLMLPLRFDIEEENNE